MRDLVVAGGGPVGLATALHAARVGLDVEVWEPRAGVIDKACGEGLMPSAVAGLAALGVAPRGRPIAGIRYTDGTTSAEAPFTSGPGLGVRRTTLHAALAGAVAAAGIPVRQDAVRSVEQRSDHVMVDGVPARYLVGADGLHSPVRRLTGLERAVSRRRPQRRFGLRWHATTAPWTDFVEVHWSPRGEVYVTPVSDTQVGLALLSDTSGAAAENPRPGFADVVGDHPALAARLDGLEVGRPRGAGPLRQRSRHRTAGRVLLVGDAAGYVDALTGEGIALGLAQAEAAVAAVTAGDARRYERDWWRLSWKHDLMTRGLVGATRAPAVRSRIVPAAQRMPRVFGWAVDQLASPA